MRAVAESMANVAGDFPCAVSDSACAITETVSNHFGRFLDAMTDSLGSLLGVVDRMNLA